MHRLLRPTLSPYTTLFRSVRPYLSADLKLNLARPTALAPGDVQGLETWRDTQHAGPGSTPVWRTESRGWARAHLDRKSTRLNSSHLVISYAVFCLKKKIHI